MDTEQTNEFDNIPEDAENWSNEDWVKYYTKDGILSLDEGFDLLFKMIDEAFGKNPDDGSN